MAYDKKTWENGDIIDATSLNDIEDAIATPFGITMVKVTSVYNGSTGTETYICDKTAQDILDIMTNGNLVIVFFDNYYIEDGQRLWDSVSNVGDVYQIDSVGAHFVFWSEDRNWHIDYEGNVSLDGDV